MYPKRPYRSGAKTIRDVHCLCSLYLPVSVCLSHALSLFVSYYFLSACYCHAYCSLYAQRSVRQFHHYIAIERFLNGQGSVPQFCTNEHYCLHLLLDENFPLIWQVCVLYETIMRDLRMSRGPVLSSIKGHAWCGSWSENWSHSGALFLSLSINGNIEATYGSGRGVSRGTSP